MLSIKRSTGLREVSLPSSMCVDLGYSHSKLMGSRLILKEGSDDDIREIQREISLLSTCASPHVTQYKTSFVRGVKLWIVMEYLGGGSCLDLVFTSWQAVYC